MRGILTLTLLGLLFSCTHQVNRPAILTKDDALMVDQTRLSVSGLISLKKNFDDLSREQRIWAITACVALQSQARAQGRELLPDAAVRIVYYALGKIDPTRTQSDLREYLGSESSSPAQARQSIESVLSRSVVQKNMQVLAEIL